MKIHAPIALLTVLFMPKNPTVVTLCVLSLFTAAAVAQVQPDAKALLDSAGQKLATAQTIRLTAQHKLDPSLGYGGKIDRGPITVTLQRPNKFHAIQPAGDETREVASDGKHFVLMYPQRKHHAIEPLRTASNEEFADAVDQKIGFRPPLAELLAGNLTAEMLRNVTAAGIVGPEYVGFTRCKRLLLVQDGMTTDLWIGGKDKLPRRMKFTFTEFSGKPTWDIRIRKWEMNPAVDDSLFSKRPAADSTRVALLKSLRSTPKPIVIVP